MCLGFLRGVGTMSGAGCQVDYMLCVTREITKMIRCGREVVRPMERKKEEGPDGGGGVRWARIFGHVSTVLISTALRPKNAIV